MEAVSLYQWVVGCPGAVLNHRCDVVPSNSTSNHVATPCTEHVVPATNNLSGKWLT
jgi:hypothetical protein